MNINRQGCRFYFIFNKKNLHKNVSIKFFSSLEIFLKISCFPAFWSSIIFNAQLASTLITIAVPPVEATTIWSEVTTNYRTFQKAYSVNVAIWVCRWIITPLCSGMFVCKNIILLSANASKFVIISYYYDNQEKNMKLTKNIRMFTW